MPPITATTQVDCSAEEVFDYATDPSHFHEWQKGVVDGHMDSEGSRRVGSKCFTTRQIGFAKRPVTSEVVEVDPPRSWRVRGIDGPVRADVVVTVEPESESRSRLTIAIEFEGHGIGRMLVPFVVRREARKEMPVNLASLKRRLEAGTERP
jgi:uncharacterized protein YndB with AHSA1/START domain